jgi:hypothetical protein
MGCQDRVSDVPFEAMSKRYSRKMSDYYPSRMIGFAGK